MQHLSLKKTLAKQEMVLASVEADRQALEVKVKMMRPESLDPDLLTERIRHVLGYKYADEAVILSFPG